MQGAAPSSWAVTCATASAWPAAYAACRAGPAFTAPINRGRRHGREVTACGTTGPSSVSSLNLRLAPPTWPPRGPRLSAVSGHG